MKKRLTHIDNAKAFGIMLIVASHVVLECDYSTAWESALYNRWVQALSSFYVPLFFLLSGIFESSKTDWKVYFTRLTRCAKYVAVFAVWGIATYAIINGSINLKIGFLTYTPIWFLIVLLYITLMFGLIKCHNAKYQRLIVLLGGDWCFSCNR